MSSNEIDIYGSEQNQSSYSPAPSSIEVNTGDNFKKLVGLIDKLRDIGLNDLISMPRIAVLGSQSSGKSSLLESIVGINFLPRGSGVVTRRPLELRLQRSKTNRPFGVFPKDMPNEKFYDFDKIRMNIEMLTDKVCGDNKGIVDDPIVLQVFSADTPDLTVIDLPGITRIAIGDQPKDIERITKTMVKRYCEDDRTIILCVLAANSDMSTSEALQMSMMLDDKGMRTIGVITKIDIMDKGTDARSMLLGEEVKLRLGYIGVKGRSQEDINNKMTVKEALGVEEQYFRSHPKYNDMSDSMLGTGALIKKMSAVMHFHIKNVLPSIIKEINQKIHHCENNLASLGDPIPLDNKEKLDQMWRDISRFYTRFKAQIKGSYAFDGLGITTNKNEKKSKKGILASSKIHIIFSNLYKPFMQNYKISKKYKDKDILKTVKMYKGNTLPGFVSMDTFIALCSPLLEELRNPAISTLYKVYNIIKGVGSEALADIFESIPQLKEVLNELFDEKLQEVIKPCFKIFTLIRYCYS